MRPARIVLFLTFVLLCLDRPAMAAPVPLSPDIEDDQSSRRPPEPPALEKSSHVLEIAQPPPGHGVAIPQDYFFPYRRSFTLRFGQVYSTSKAGMATGLAGLAFMMTTEDRQAYEAGADLLSDGGGDLHLSRRYIFTQSKLRPYGKLGAGILVNPADGLALFVNFANYRALASIGTEYLIRRAESVRIDLEVSVSTKTIQLVPSVGYSWAW